MRKGDSPSEEKGIIVLCSKFGAIFAPALTNNMLDGIWVILLSKVQLGSESTENTSCLLAGHSVGQTRGSLLPTLMFLDPCCVL